MAKKLVPTDVLYFASLLYREDLIGISQVRSQLEVLLGPIHSVYQSTYFPMKSYYAKEMGQESLLKRFLFASNIKQIREKIIPLKNQVYKLEQEYKQPSGGRIFNIDVGYVAMEQVVLATHKPYSHRIYLGESVFGELTYTFEAKHFHVLSWTYPDYQDPKVIEWFELIRQNLIK